MSETANAEKAWASARFCAEKLMKSDDESVSQMYRTLLRSWIEHANQFEFLDWARHHRWRETERAPSLAPDQPCNELTYPRVLTSEVPTTATISCRMDVETFPDTLRPRGSSTRC